MQPVRIDWRLRSLWESISGYKLHRFARIVFGLQKLRKYARSGLRKLLELIVGGIDRTCASCKNWFHCATCENWLRTAPIINSGSPARCKINSRRFAQWSTSQFSQLAHYELSTNWELIPSDKFSHSREVETYIILVCQCGSALAAYKISSFGLHMPRELISRLRELIVRYKRFDWPRLAEAARNRFRSAQTAKIDFSLHRLRELISIVQAVRLNVGAILAACANWNLTVKSIILACANRHQFSKLAPHNQFPQPAACAKS